MFWNDGESGLKSQHMLGVVLDAYLQRQIDGESDYAARLIGPTNMLITGSWKVARNFYTYSVGDG